MTYFSLCFYLGPCEYIFMSLNVLLCMSINGYILPHCLAVLYQNLFKQSFIASI